jgi:hypothetical protein
MTRPGSNIPRLRAAFRRAAALTIVVIVTVVAGWAGGRPPLAAAATTSVAQREYLIKAAFVYDMLKATQWPKTRSGRVLLCVLGRDPFGAAWRSIAGRPIGKSKLEVAPVQAGGDLAACYALFLSTSERARWPDIRAALGTRPILTMSEMTGFAQDGGMVGLMAIDNRLRFDVNLKAVRKAGLSIDTNALEQANMVHAQAASVGLP